MANRPRRNRNRVTRLSLGAGRLVLRPTRAVAGDMLEPVAEAAVDHALAGPLPEAIAHSLVEHRVIERIVREMLATGDLSRLEQALDDEALERTVERVLASPRTERLIGDAIERALASDAIHRVLTSPEFEHLLTETMSSPAVRNAIAEQTATPRRRDGALHARVRHADRRAPRPAAHEGRRRPMRASRRAAPRSCSTRCSRASCS